VNGQQPSIASNTALPRDLYWSLSTIKNSQSVPNIWGRSDNRFESDFPIYRLSEVARPTKLWHPYSIVYDLVLWISTDIWRLSEYAEQTVLLPLVLFCLPYTPEMVATLWCALQRSSFHDLLSWVILGCLLLLSGLFAATSPSFTRKFACNWDGRHTRDNLFHWRMSQTLCHYFWQPPL
jgi:hypothetical protein